MTDFLAFITLLLRLLIVVVKLMIFVLCVRLMYLNLGYELHCRTPSTVLTARVLCLHLIMPRIYCRAMQRRLAVKIRQQVTAMMLRG